MIDGEVLHSPVLFCFSLMKKYMTVPQRSRACYFLGKMVKYNAMQMFQLENIDENVL